MESRETGVLNVSAPFRSMDRVSRSPSQQLFPLILAVSGVAGLVIWQFQARKPASSRDADVPLAMPDSGEPDHRFQFLSAWQAARIPKATRFDPPLGTEHSGLVHQGRKFWEMNEELGGHHTGNDLDGIGGMNTDLGDPVFSAADGLVLYAGEASPGWGNLVVIAHKAPDGRPLHSMYAHLHRIEVNVGELVARGGKVGAVGTANGHYPAHLHFEMRLSDGVDIGAGDAKSPLNRLDPTATIESLRNAANDDLSPSPLARVLGEKQGAAVSEPPRRLDGR